MEEIELVFVVMEFVVRLLINYIKVKFSLGF